MTRVQSVLRHPLFITAATLVVTVFFADRIAQVSGDRQRELDVKQRLLTQVADASTTVVSNAGDAAERAPRDDKRKGVYRRLAGQWHIEWSRVNSQLQVYFEDETILSEWAAFAERFDRYLSVAVLRPASRTVETERLRKELTGKAFRSDAELAVARKIDWSCIAEPASMCPFLDDLALAGRLLLRHREQLDRRIREEPVVGFTHRIFPPW